MKENLWNRFLNLFFPRRCACCKQVIAEGALCESCLPSLKTLHSPVIPCESPLDGLTAVFYYSGAGAALMREFKFHRQFQCYQLLLQETFENQIDELYQKFNYSTIIPVPMYIDAKRKRGFNQSEYIASRLAKSMSLPYQPSAIKKIRSNKVQHHLSKAERAQNVKNVYKVELPHTVADKTVLLVDDITTTGATLQECAAVLKAAGAAKVYGAAVFFTPHVQLLDKV